LIPILIPIGLWVGYSLLKNSKAVAPIVPSIEVPGVFPWGTTRPYSIRDAPSPDLPSRDYYPPATPPETIRSASLSTLVGDLVSPVSGVLGPLLSQASSTLVENLMIPVKKGVLGTKTNPIPMNKYNGGISFIAITGNQDGFTPIAANLKTWFVLDSAVMAAVTSRTVIRFGFSVQGFNNVDVLYTKVVQDKAGNDLSAEVGLQNNTGDAWDQVTNNQPYNFLTTKFLYSIESPGKIFIPTVKVNFILQYK